MTKLIKLNLLKDKESVINKLKEKSILVYEDIQGSKLYVRWNGSNFDIHPKSTSNDPLNFVDLAVQKYYNNVYFYLHSLPDYVTNLLSSNWYFCFEYFPDNQPAHIEYNQLPKNNLILTCIVKGSKFTYNYDELVEYSNLFDVDCLPVLFKGKLSPKQIEVLILFLNTSEEDLKFVFGESNFAHFFYKILNPLEDKSFLMKDGEYNKNLEKVIMKIEGDHRYTFEIFNPLYKKMNYSNDTEYLKMYTLILINFLEYCQINNIEKYKPSNITKDKLYVDLICLIFNDYIKDIQYDIEDWNIEIPKFFTEDKFKINYELLNNKETVNYIKYDAKIEYIFKIILNSFNHYKKKSVGLFTEQTLVIFNETVNKISNYLDTLLKFNKENKNYKKDLLNFKDYFNVDYNVDTTGKLYLNDDKFKLSDEPNLDKKGKKLDKSGITKGKLK